MQDKVREAKELFPGAVSILSNSVGTDDDVNYEAAILTSTNMAIPVIRHKHKKPAMGLLDEIVHHYRASMNIEPSVPIRCHEICMVGDRLLTDIVFANQLGMVSVLVAPINSTRDHPVAVVLRYIIPPIVFGSIYVKTICIQLHYFL